MDRISRQRSLMSYCLPWTMASGPDGAKISTGGPIFSFSRLGSARLWAGYMPRCQLHDDPPLHIDTQADDKKKELSKSVSSPILLLLVLAIFASTDFDVERAEIHHRRPCTRGHEERERERERNIGNISNAAGITRIIIKRGIHFTMRKRKSADDIFSTTRRACGLGAT